MGIYFQGGISNLADSISPNAAALSHNLPTLLQGAHALPPDFFGGQNMGQSMGLDRVQGRFSPGFQNPPIQDLNLRMNPSFNRLLPNSLSPGPSLGGVPQNNGFSGQIGAMLLPFMGQVMSLLNQIIAMLRQVLIQQQQQLQEAAKGNLPRLTQSLPTSPPPAISTGVKPLVSGVASAPKPVSTATQAPRVVPVYRPPKPYTKNVDVALANGKKLILNDYPSNLADSIKGLGGSGTTENMSSLLENLAHQLLQQGELSSTEAADLIGLAKEGYNIAELELLLEESAEKSGTNRGSFLNTWIKDTNNTAFPMVDLSNRLFFHFDPAVNTVSFKSLPPEVKAFYDTHIGNAPHRNPELARHVSPVSIQKHDNYVNKGQGEMYVGKDLSNFIIAYNKVNKSKGIIKNPKVQELITKIAANISLMAHHSRITSHFTAEPYAPYNIYTPNRFDELLSGFYVGRE